MRLVGLLSLLGQRVTRVRGPVQGVCASQILGWIQGVMALRLSSVSERGLMGLLFWDARQLKGGAAVLGLWVNAIQSGVSPEVL